MKSIVLCAVTFLLLQQALTLAFSDADVDEVDELGGRYRRARRGWSMMRLGRGLQMLRLGKRTAPSPPSHVPQASPEKMRELLGALLEEEEGQEYRRQPPMPRYGRDLDDDEEEEVLEELIDLLREMQPKSRHASRFMRSADDARVRSGEDSTSDSAKQSFSSGS